MGVKTKRWNDPVEPDDGYRLLVCRYRPRGVKREGEPWDAWLPQLGPSAGLFDAFYGKTAPPISWEAYATRYLKEMENQRFFLRGLAEKVRRGEALTLLCSSACVDETHCHRTLLRGLIERALAPETAPAGPAVVKRRTARPTGRS